MREMIEVAAGNRGHAEVSFRSDFSQETYDAVLDALERLKTRFEEEFQINYSAQQEEEPINE